MSSRVIKVSSRQNHEFTSSKNLVDFDVPEGAYDLSKSYFVLHTECSSSNSNNISLLRLEKDSASGTASGTLDDNISFVRNGKLRASQAGMVEYNRNINILRTNQLPYEESFSRAGSCTISNKMSGLKDIDDLRCSNFRNINKLGSNLSTDKEHGAIIPFSHVFNFAKNGYYNSKDKGSLSVNLELDLENFSIVQDLDSSDNYWTRNSGNENNHANNTFETFSNGATQLEPKHLYNKLSESPFYVGQRISVSGTNLTTAEVQIIDIAFNSQSRRLTLTIDTALVSTADVADGVCVGVDDAKANSQVKFPGMDLVLVQVEEQEPVANYQYTTYELQEDTVATQSLNKNYLVSPMAKNVFVCFPENSVALQSRTQVNDYRFSIDNEYQSNRPIVFGDEHDSLHRAQVLKCYDNMDEKLMNLSGVYVPTSNNDTRLYIDAPSNFMIMTPTPITPQHKTLNVEVNTGANMGRVLIFSEVVKQI